MDTIKEECHECGCMCLLTDSILRIFPKKEHFVETSNQWLIGKDIINGVAKIENKRVEGYYDNALWEKDIWTYCANCYIKYTMKCNKYLCLNCGCYETYQGCPPIIKKNDNFVSANMRIGDFNFIDNKKPKNIDEDGKLCMVCLQNFIVEGLLIPKSEYYSEKLSYIKPTQCISQHSSEKRSIKDICVFCNIENEFIENCNNTCYNMINNTEISNGHNRVYKAKLNDSNIILDNMEYPASVCDKCINIFSLEEIKTISCDLCLNQFIDSQCGGGSNCASFIEDNGVFCGYGSDHDTEQYRWKTGGKPNIFTNIKKICDKCLIHLVDQKLLIPDGEYNLC